VKFSRSRAEYLELLAGEWWSGMDLDDVRHRAEIFAGWWFCAPDWQGGFVLGDDAKQDALYESISALVTRYPREVSRELATLQNWWQSGHRYYHTSKMREADAFGLTNIN
jgi:hypothetical protein